MKNFNDRILKALSIIISINLVVYGGFDPDDEDDEEDLALLFENASVAEVDTYEELTAALNNVRTGGTLYLTDTSEKGTGLITGGFANSGGGIFNVGSIQILGSNSIRDNESDQGPDNVFQMHGAVIDNEFYPKSEHP